MCIEKKKRRLIKRHQCAEHTGAKTEALACCDTTARPCKHVAARHGGSDAGARTCVYSSCRPSPPPRKTVVKCTCAMCVCVCVCARARVCARVRFSDAHASSFLTRQGMDHVGRSASGASRTPRLTRMTRDAMFKNLECAHDTRCHVQKLGMRA
jgi:hypothetical protein